MKNCKDMGNKISLYLDDVLSAEDKRKLEEHLKACPKCREALADMQKVKAMTRELSELEPPPWFKQKIMAQVREEAQKKSFTEKWFYPLRIKIPVQVFAAIFIVVIAVYVYRAGNEQFREVMPPVATAPLTQEQKEEPAAAEYEPAEIAAPPAYRTTDEEKVVAGSIISDKQDYARQLSRKESNADAETPEVKSRSLQAVMEKDVSSAQMKQESHIIVLRVSDIDSAAAHLEKILAEYNASRASKQSTDGKVVFRAEIGKENLKDFIQKLKTLGVIENKVSADVDALEQIPVVIEIQDQ
ncbi:MAG TPA: DUF2275 domain-containing protein [Deltaproteobacteria bacterium]|nr:DUF2275 domain-containing protein [Deltaproteobacteria bacterium]